MGAALSRRVQPSSRAGRSSLPGLSAVRRHRTKTEKSPVKERDRNDEEGDDDDDDDEEEDVVPSANQTPSESVAHPQGEGNDGGDDDPTDPILLTKIRKDSLTFEFVRPNANHQHVTYRAESLIDYMLATGDFFEPETRIEFSDADLQALDVIGARLERASVVEAKRNAARLKERRTSETDVFAGVERCAGETVAEMLRIVETTQRRNVSDAEVDLLVRVCPQFRHYVGLLYSLDADECVAAVDQFKRFLRGPPNKKTKDQSRVLLGFCLEFIDETMAQLWNDGGTEENTGDEGGGAPAPPPPRMLGDEMKHESADEFSERTASTNVEE